MAYDQVASQQSIDTAVAALTADGFAVFVVDDGAAALKKAIEIIPAGAEVMTMSSVTCTQIGLYKEIDESGRYDAVRPKLLKMDRKTQDREMQRMGAAPEWSVGSVHAVTEDGHLLLASASGSQIPAHAAGAARVLFVAGTQKIVKDTADGLKRIREYAFPLEDARAKKAYGFGSSINDILIMNKVPQFAPGRVTLILIKQKIGF